MGAPATSPCDACDARCCSAYAVHVTGDDAWRLAEGTGLPLHAFLAHARRAGPGPTGFALAPGGPAHDLLLAHARPAHDRPPCPFLRAGEGGWPRCGVYPLRPRACRRFPAAHLASGFGVREGVACPPGAWARHDMGRLSWRVALAREERETRAYAAVVAAWNDRVARAPAGAPATLVDFLEFLEDAYRWLVRWRASHRPAERSGATQAARIREILGAWPTR